MYCSNCARCWLFDFGARLDGIISGFANTYASKRKAILPSLFVPADLFHFAGGLVKLQMQRTRHVPRQASAYETLLIGRPASQASCPCTALPYCGLAAALACLCFLERLVCQSQLHNAIQPGMPSDHFGAASSFAAR